MKRMPDSKVDRHLIANCQKDIVCDQGILIATVHLCSPRLLCGGVISKREDGGGPLLLLEDHTMVSSLE